MAIIREINSNSSTAWRVIIPADINTVDKNYELVAYHGSRDWTTTIGLIILSIIGILLLFELVRRGFYYVFLGKINPEK